MKKQKESPCVNCRRTPDPRQCENKDCKAWRLWFINRWEQMRRMYQPDQDPCTSCPCSQTLCFEKCARKIQWEEEEVRQ